MRARALATAGIMLAVSAGAHHSTGPFDMTRSATITGVVTEFSWINPHAYIYIDAKEDEIMRHWKIEIESPNALRRSGWTKMTLQSGETISCVGARAKDSSSYLLKAWIVILPDGRQLSAQGEPLTFK